MANFGASDRCDRCSAAALVEVVLVSGSRLQFCGHHAKAAEAAGLKEAAAFWDDEQFYNMVNEETTKVEAVS